MFQRTDYCREGTGSANLVDVVGDELALALNDAAVHQHGIDVGRRGVSSASR